MTVERARKPHASLEARSRSRKAKKIAAIISRLTTIHGACVLEVGTGSGLIAAYFAEAVGPDGQVVAVDVVDQRLHRSGFEFRLVDDTMLPFDGAFADVCISNHVIEHVGNRSAQLQHLKELARVLKDGGLIYLAVPNRWRLIEPHFNLPFLSWLPPRLADKYVRSMKRGRQYDCNPPSRYILFKLIEEAKLDPIDATRDAMHYMAESGEFGKYSRLIERFGKIFFTLGHFFVPTYVLILRKISDSVSTSSGGGNG